MDFALLGRLVVRVNGTELPLDGGRQWAVLALLLMRPNTIVTTDTLVEELWGAKPTATSTNAVHGYVSRLRKRLGRDVIETRSRGYVLRVGPGALDVERFEDRLEQGSRLLAGGAAEEARRVLGEALVLWRGPALADFRYESFARAEAARLEELKLVALEERIEADIALGRHARLIGELEAFVAAHPHRERLRGQLMLALYRSGRQADALEAYRDARAALDELGLEPGAKLKQLQREILAQDPSLELPVAPVAEAGVVDALSPSRGERGRWAQRKLVTVLVVGVRGTTKAGESLDPEVLSALHADCLERMRVVVERHGGAVGELVGEVAMAVFGLPVVHEDDAVRALRAAVEMREAMIELGIEGRIGIDSGVVISGGGGQAVTGSAVTRAVRLERAARSGEVLVGEQTLRLAREAATAEQLDLQDGRGPVEAWRLASVSAQVQSRHSDLPFVGREQELRALSQTWERVRLEQRCELVTVVGEAGVGKSRLVAELLPRVEATVAHGRCPSYGAGITYSPVVDVLTQLRPALAELDPAVAAPLASLTDDSSSASTGELAWAFRKLVEAAAHERPLILVFDDIQWAEEALLELIEHVALLSNGAPILLVCIARPELLERRPSWHGQLRLEPLTRQETEQLIQARLGGDGDVTQRIVAAAGGNPLFAEELSAMPHDSADEQLALPPTLQALLTARLDQLDDAERAVLEAAAVEGEVFHLGALQALTPDKPDFTAQLTALVRKELLRPDRATLEGEDAFRFRHLLLRDATYEAIPKATRSRLHESYADWLERRAAGMDAFVGYHLEQAHRYRGELSPPDDESRALGERAATHLGASGRRAKDRGDHRAAVNLLERALAAGFADPHARARRQFELEGSLGLLGRWAERDTVFAEATATATRLGDPALITHVRLVDAIAMIDDPESDLEVPRRIAQEAIETLSELGDQRGLAEVHRFYAGICEREGNLGESLAHLERALAGWEAAGSREERRATTGVIVASLCHGPVPVGDGIRRCEELILRGAGERALEARVAGRMSALVAMAGRAEEALELVGRSSPELDELSSVIPSLITRDAVAEAKEYAGDRAGAIQEREAQCQKLEEIFTRRSPTWAISAAYKLALLYCDENRWEDAGRRLAYGPELPVPTRFREPVVLRLAGRARVAAHHGRHGEAVGLATKAVELAEQSDMLNLRGRVWEAHAEVQRAASRQAEADTALETAVRLYESKGNVAAAASLRTAVT